MCVCAVFVAFHIVTGQMNMLNMGHMGRNQSPNVLYQGKIA